jgi:hypothetical protein
MEWKVAPQPRHNERRIVKRFCFMPRACEGDIIVWLGFVHLLQTYSNTWGEWKTDLIFSPSQYKDFLKDIAIHLVDPREDMRIFAQRALEKQKKYK